MVKKEFVKMKLGDLIPYENNPRKNEDAVPDVAESIRQCGDLDPIEVDEDNVILSGHTRLLALRRQGFKETDVIRYTGLTEEQKKKYRLLANKTGEKATWDLDKLAEELDDLDFDGFDFGFDLDLDGILEDEKEIEEDEVPVKAESRCKLGDLWQLGRHRLICGDSTDSAVIDRLMDGAKADCVFTDPPYNIASDSTNFTKNSNSPHMRELANTEWDKNFDIKEVLDNILISIAKNATVYVCTSHFLASDIWAWMKEWSNHYSYCVWSKPNPMPSLSKRHWTWNTELICYATRGKHTFNFPKEGHALSTWTINKINGKTGHPTEKPVEVPAMAISHSSKENDVVLDLFGGSGSTLIACEQLNRRCYMCELDEHYCDVIIQRWENLTGKKATRIKITREE